MLDMKKQNEKTFEEWMEETLQKIPMYSSEWTNFNPSDPGITILENLIAFHVLQQTQIDEPTPKAVQRLLEIAGIRQRPGKCARVLLCAEHLKEAVEIPANQQFRAGSLIFETEKACKAGGSRLTGVYGVDEGEVLDGTVLLNEEMPLSVKIFGEEPKVGNAVYFIMDSIPEEKELRVYVHTVNTPYRNAFVDSVNNHFAKISWQYYTEHGFKDIQCKDTTKSFLTDGELDFRGLTEPAVYDKMQQKGYCIRGVLKEVDYDIPPRLLSVHGFLLEAVQRETSCIIKSCRKSKTVEINCNLLEDGYFRVFCREGEGKSYRRYDLYDKSNETGRYYELLSWEGGNLRIQFDKPRFCFGPTKVKDAIRIVIYNEAMMQQYNLGMVYGYDNQEMELPVTHIVPENFCLLAERRDEDGTALFDFVKPGKKEEGSLKYELLETEGKIRIVDAGDFIEARLFLANLSTYRGEEGNIRPNNQFTAQLSSGEIVLTNPAPGAGGCLKETVTAMRKRFYDEMRRPETAVCARDYEEMVQKVSGLCIHKVRAVMDYKKNEVCIIIKPWSEEPFPGLTPLYRNMLEKYFESRRLLATRIRFTGPKYVGIDVRGVIYVKRHYERCKEEIEEVLKRHLDYRNGIQNFGEILRFEKLFYELEQLECIDSMQNLSLYPQNHNMAVVEGVDIHPAEDCLCYPGNFYLDIHAGQTGTY